MGFYLTEFNQDSSCVLFRLKDQPNKPQMADIHSTGGTSCTGQEKGHLRMHKEFGANWYGAILHIYMDAKVTDYLQD